ncbi:MAG: hypothetical protein FWG73_02260 [Planctomycetaceae bacterium]|nr:hypothetical protein [Planctomycetaceae bacterium]
MRKTTSKNKTKSLSKPEGFYVLPVYVPTLQTATKWLTSQAVLYLVLLIAGVGMGLCWQGFWQFNIQPTVRPAPVNIETESLEDFVAREAERLLTTDERTKLIAVAEKILHQDFTRPSAIVEEFSFQRRLAGINSPAFNAFSDKWAEKVETMKTENVESMRQVYQSLLQGLERSQEREVRSQEGQDDVSLIADDNREDSEAILLPPDSYILTPDTEEKPPQVEKQKQTVQRQRLFR